MDDVYSGPGPARAIKKCFEPARDAAGKAAGDVIGPGGQRRKQVIPKGGFGADEPMLPPDPNSTFGYGVYNFSAYTRKISIRYGEFGFVPILGVNNGMGLKPVSPEFSIYGVESETTNTALTRAGQAERKKN